jgi:hypothetical protein
MCRMPRATGASCARSSRSNRIGEIGNGDIGAPLLDHLLNSQTTNSIDDQRCANPRTDLPVTALLAGEDGKHHRDIFRLGLAENRQLFVGQGQFIIEADCRRFDDLQCQFRIIQRLQGIANRCPLGVFMNQNEAAIAGHAGKTLGKFNDLGRINFDGAKKQGIDLHAFLQC